MSEKKKPFKSLFSSFLSPEEQGLMLIYHTGCMGAIIAFTLFLYWLVRLFK